MSKNKKAMLIGCDAAVYPIILRLIDEGHLPNLKRLITEGAGSEAACCLPPYTPTNWATLCTGAWPGTHGAGNWMDNTVDASPIDSFMSTFDSRTITAETIWEAAERAGLKSLCTAYPAAYPKRTKNGYVVAPLHRGLVTMLMIRGNEYATTPTLRGGMKIEPKPAEGWKGAPEGALEALLMVQEPAEEEVILTCVGEDGVIVEEKEASSGTKVTITIGVQYDLLLINSNGQGYDKALLCENKDATNPVAELRLDEWSPWLFGEYRTARAPDPQQRPIDFARTDVDLEGIRQATTRFKLLHLSPDGKDVRLVRSEVYPATNFTDPPELSEELVREVGPYFEHSVSRLTPTVIEKNKEILDILLEEVRYQALWHPRAARYVMEHHGWDIYYLHWHWPDTVAHQTMRAIDPESPTYDPAKAELYMDVIRRSYQIMDEMVGGFLELADDNTYIVVVADHGCTPDYRAVDISRLLSQKGLCTFKDDSFAASAMDLSKTRAYRSGAFQITINLKGRNPQGIVEPEDYGKVQEEIIDALQTWRDPDNGKLVTSFAMTKRDAQLFGYWGNRTGDVLYLFNHGYWWGDPSVAAAFAAHPETTVVDAPPMSAHHGPNLPTDGSNMTSNLSTFILWGPGIKAGYSRDPERRGFVRLMDVVPTLCHLLGIQPPKECEGTVLWDHFEE